MFKNVFNVFPLIFKIIAYLCFEKDSFDYIF